MTSYEYRVDLLPLKYSEGKAGGLQQVKVKSLKIGALLLIRVRTPSVTDSSLTSPLGRQSSESHSLLFPHCRTLFSVFGLEGGAESAG